MPFLQVIISTSRGRGASRIERAPGTEQMNPGEGGE